ncbi:MAG: PQQ-dependent sugar dehydrogenase, partial [Thaumarchaeota archaeon]|nr:PQQ-dependent sugar dehydrogenase [Nitrososphaerota archaeon]
YAYLMQNGQVVQSGFTPATFILNNTLTYSVGIDNYPPYAFDHWSDTGSTANPRTISISSDTQITGIFQDTDLTLSPYKGPDGTRVSVTGTSFSANSTVTLAWDGTALATSPATVTSDSTGGFAATFLVPSTAAAGSHTVQATDGIHTHSTMFTVNASPTISLSTNSVNVGTDVRVTGAGFTPDYLITLSFDGVPIGVGAQDVGSGSTSPLTVTTDSNGNFVAIMQVLRAVTGMHTISAEDSVNDVASQSVILSPHVFIFPTTAKPGQSILIPPSQGNGFAANSTITIKFDGTPISPSGSITTDSTGNFGGTFTVPATAAAGSHVITISDSKGDTYTVQSFTVDPNAHSFSSQIVATGLAPPCSYWAGCTDVPANFAFIPDGNLTTPSSGAFMVNEKNSGNVLVFKNSNGQFVRQSVPFVNVPSLQVNYETNGLMGIAFDPNWANAVTPEKWVYLYVTRNQTVNGATTDNIIGEVIRYHATTDSSGNIIADSSVGEQLVLGPIPAFVNGHNGGGLKFDSKGNLYVSTGDGWGFDTTAQDLASYQGKILRITPVYGSQVNGQWYTIPSSNPFASSTNPVTQDVWAYGERNPYAWDLDQSTGKMYISSTGFNTWEAILNATAGSSNDGWSDYERPAVGNPVDLQNYVPALYWYGHQGMEPQTGPAAGLEALSAGAFYHGTAYPGLDGAYFFGDYGVGNIQALLPSNTAAPATDPLSGVQESQAVPILYGLTLGPIYMEEWNGKLYFMDLNGNMNVINYN